MGGLRYQGPFGDEWISGGYLKNFGIIAIMYIFFNYRNKLGKNISFIFLSLVFLTILISGEKMSLIIFSLFSLFFFVVHFKNFKFQLIILIIFFLGIFSFLSYNSPQFLSSDLNKYEKISYRYTHQFLEILGFTETSRNFFSDTPHGIHFLTAYEIFKKKKYYGTGIKTFRIYCDYIDPKIIENYGASKKRAKLFRCTSHPHNFILEILSETGLVGFFGYLVLMSSVFFKFNWNFNQNSNLNLPYLISFIFFIFPFATSGSFFNNYNSIILWIFLSFIFFKEKKITE